MGSRLFFVVSEFFRKLVVKFTEVEYADYRTMWGVFGVAR